MFNLFRKNYEKPKVKAHFNSRAEAYAYFRKLYKDSGGANDRLKLAVEEMKKADKALSHARSKPNRDTANMR